MLRRSSTAYAAFRAFLFVPYALADREGYAATQLMPWEGSVSRWMPFMIHAIQLTRWPGLRRSL